MADAFTATPVSGNKTNNVSTPGTGLALESLAAMVGAQTYSSGNLALLTVDTTGAARIVDVTSGSRSVNLAQIAGTTTDVSNGTVSAGTQRVVIASDQTAYSVNAIQSGTWNINNIAGTIALPTGAATEASLAKLTIAPGTALGSNTLALNGGSVTTSAPTYTTGQIDALSLQTDGSLRVAVTNSTSNQNVNLAQVSGASIDIGNGAAGSGTARFAIANDSIVSVSATSSANLVTNPLFVKLTDGTDPFGTASNPFYTVDTSSSGTLSVADNLVATSVASNGGTGTLTGNVIGGTTGKLLQAHVTSSVRIKAELQTYDGTTATTKRVFFVPAFDSFTFKPSQEDEITFAADVTNVFRWVVTNMDKTDTADIYGSVTHVEV